MPHIYSAENHDWDITLRSAWYLLHYGQGLEKIPKDAPLGHGFPCLTGSMLLSFCAVESFSESLAFSLGARQSVNGFSYDCYRRQRRFWDKIDMLCAETGCEADKSQGLFQNIKKMQAWRNLVTHAAPYSIEETEIESTIDSTKLHAEHSAKQFAREVSVQNATKFYDTAVEYTQFFTEHSGIEPRSRATYVVGNEKDEK